MSTIKEWLDEIINLCQPSNVHICSGSDNERNELIDLMVKDNMLIKLNENLRPNSYLARSDPNDVARLEKFTYVCTKDKTNAGPNNNWMDPVEMKSKMISLMTNTMANKTMYVIPFVMGPIYNNHSIYGIQVTDSPYVTVNMSIMTHMGTDVYDYLIDNNCEFIKCVHSTGCSGDGWTSTSGNKLSLKWYSNSTKYIVHFPEELSVYSYGSGYGGNALLGKKSVSLRIASYMGKNNNWLAEHMLLIRLTHEQGNGREVYVTGAFPSSCGKTNLALMKPALPGWIVSTLGDDITWFRPGYDGKLYAINPETGFFGVAPNTSYKTNPNAMDTISSNTIFTNVALTSDGDVWWEGMSDVPINLIDWHGNKYMGGYEAAHPNSRFTVPITNCPTMYQTNEWVPVSAMLFGGKRKDLVPLVRQSLSWNHGVYMGSTVCSEQTAAAEGIVGQLRYDPFAMLPFCGYNMGDYFKHWINIGKQLAYPPKIFYVNWFKKDSLDNFIWPGFSQNIRVLQWIYQRITTLANATRTPIGYIPNHINLDGIDVTMDKLFEIDPTQWIKQLQLDNDYLSVFADRLPEELIEENKRMINELSKCIE